MGAEAGSSGVLRGVRKCLGVGSGEFSSLSAHTTLVRLVTFGLPAVRRSLSSREWMAESSELNFAIEIELKSLILAQIERWRHALHMQVERGAGATLHSVANG